MTAVPSSRGKSLYRNIEIPSHRRAHIGVNASEDGRLDPMLGISACLAGWLDDWMHRNGNLYYMSSGEEN